MSWIDINVGSGSSGSGSSNNLLSGIINSLGNALSNASFSGGFSGGYPRITGRETPNTLIFRDFQNLYDYLNKQNAPANQRLQNAFKRVLEVLKRLDQINQEIHHTQDRINGLNNQINHLNQEIQESSQALNGLNQEIASLNNEISANAKKISQEQEKINALELQTNAKKQVLESLKQLEKLKQDSKRLKKQSKWKKQFNFLTDNPSNQQAQQESALNRSNTKNALTNFFLTDPYAILPKGFIYEYHNPGKETYNALNAPNNMDGINNQFKTNALSQVLDNSYQKFLAGNDSHNALKDVEQVKALKFYDLTINHNPQSENLESALFFKQISQYAKGLRLKILSVPSSKKGLEKLEKLENTINQEEERLKGNDLNALVQEIEKERENALKLKENIKAKKNHTETLKNAINQKEHAKNHIEQQKQQLESSQRNEKEQQKQNQENAKRNLEQERNNLNNEINAIGNERITFKQLGTKDNFLGIQPFLNNNGAGRTHARAFFSDNNKTIREYYELETKIKNILGFYRIGQSDERILKRFLELSPQQQNELSSLLLLS
ncbi:UV radiation resistance protein [Helicobacter pylori]|nr:UV radiation resistance protein [Helicobacter pylori]